MKKVYFCYTNNRLCFPELTREDTTMALEYADNCQQLIPSTQPLSPRQAGWGKDFFAYVAPDFDETPPGFEEY